MNNNEQELLKYPEEIARFQSRCSPDVATGCLLWQGAKSGEGAGCFRPRKRVTGFSNILKAHRLAYVIAYGEIPINHCILQSCGNRLCVNSAHLIARLPTLAIDALLGENNPRAIVSDSLGRIVHDAPGTFKAISEKYGVSYSTVTAIKEESGRWARLFFDWNSVRQNIKKK
jgi:hypothetical protein